MRFDLAFFLCCCKSFLGSDPEGSESYYDLLQVDRDATQDEIKRAYKRQSLQMHPDKLAQRGKSVTPEDQARFTKMKEAYEVLSDPHKRDTYDAIGARGMKWVDEPFSIDPQELAHNFATSSVLDRSKIFAIFVAIAVAVLLLPVLICLHVDGAFGPDASWFATMTPLWLWDAFLIFYHSRVIMMGPIPRPDHIPESEWVDPLPMKKRIFSMARFLLIVLFEFLVALKLDHVVSAPWTILFLPLYAWEATTFYKKWPLARMRIVTVEDLEAALGKPFSEFSPAEKELIGQRYSVVSSTTSPDFDAAQKLKTRARHDVIKSMFRVVFAIILLFQLDGDSEWNWWLVFTPFWVMTFLICYANYQAFAEVQKMAAEKDPTLFGTKAEDLEAGKTSYGAMGNDGGSAPPAAQTPDLTEEEREELKAQVMASSSRLCSKCCSQGFLLIIIGLFVSKLQGAGFSSFLIISPFLLIAGIILCCLGCAIFGITEVPTDGIDFEAGNFYTNAEQGTVPTTSSPVPDSGGHNAAPVYVPPPPPEATQTQNHAATTTAAVPPTPEGGTDDLEIGKVTAAQSSAVDVLNDSNKNADEIVPDVEKVGSDELHDLD